jgi:hypothetical protein
VRSNKITVTSIAQQKILIVFKGKNFLVLNIVVIKLIAPIIEAAPAVCKEKIARSTAPNL